MMMVVVSVCGGGCEKMKPLVVVLVLLLLLRLMMMMIESKHIYPIDNCVYSFNYSPRVHVIYIVCSMFYCRNK
jgi:hypothetical protein